MPGLGVSAVDVGTLGRTNTLARSLPPMPSGLLGNLSYSNSEQIAQFKEMQAIAVGTADRKMAERMNRAQAKAEEQAVTKYTERAAKNNNSRSAYKRSKYGDARERGAVWRTLQSGATRGAGRYLTHIR